jgi:hypothetical protein
MNRFDRMLQEGSAVRIILIILCVALLPSFKYFRGWMLLLVVLVWCVVMLFLSKELKRAISGYFRKKRGKGIDLIDPDENIH